MSDPSPPSAEIFISAGEVSGDLHAAHLLAALRERWPGVSAWGLGGPLLGEEGMDVVEPMESFSLLGLTEVVPRLASVARLLGRLKRQITRRRPRAVVLIDFPEINLRLAAHAHSLGITVVYYIGPTVWAWRPGRIRTIRRCVDLMLSVLPFEEDIYRRAGVPVEYVGHPLVDEVRPPTPPEEFRESLRLGRGRPVVSLLPGSRRSEMRRILPPLLGAASLLSRRDPAPFFLLPAASASLAEMMAGPVEAAGLDCRLFTGRARDCLAAADAALVTSGTATLEAALIGTPFVILYRLSTLSYLAGRLLIRVPHIGLPNIIMGETVADELIQGACRPERIAREAARLLDDPALALRRREKFAMMKEKLGSGGATGRAAEAIIRVVATPSSSDTLPD